MAEAALDPQQLSWSDIPLDLAGLVLRRLPAHVDRVRFAAVCPQWRSAAREGPLPPPLPLLAFHDGTVYSLPRSEPFRLPACAGYKDACAGNRLFFSGEDGRFLKNPFSNATVTLPAMSRERIQFAGAGARRLALMDTDFDDEDLGMHMRKVVFCSPHLIAALVVIELIVRIAICKPGAASWWSVYVDSRSPMLSDIAFHQGKLYAFGYGKGDLFTVDIGVDHNTDAPYVSRIQWVINGIVSFQTMLINDFSIHNRTYLVESRGALLLVYRKMHSVVKLPFLEEEEEDTVNANQHKEFQVFQADFERSKWIKLTTIGQDQVLFLQRWCSRSVLLSQNEMPGDCIVFMENDDKDLDWYDTENSFSCRVYNMKDGKISTLLPTLSWKFDTVPPTWLFPQI